MMTLEESPYANTKEDAEQHHQSLNLGTDKIVNT